MTTNEQKGAIDPLIIVIVVLVLVIGALAFWIVDSAKDTNQASRNSSEQAETKEEVVSDVKTLDEVKQISNFGDGVTITSSELEDKDGIKVYKLVLSDGRKLVVNASTGDVISEEKTDSTSQDDSKVSATITESEAEAIAATKSTSSIKKIELESEDTKATYKIEFEDGSKVEIDATSGTIIKSEIKNEQ